MLHVCPTDVVKAPADRVWHLVATPNELARWSGTKLVEAPHRELRAGDRLTFGAGFGGRLRVMFRVEDAIPPQHLSLYIRLPFGVINNEVIQITPLAADTSRITFN
jgi:uncharacterized protein YndB with AHSA1/START domain